MFSIQTNTDMPTLYKCMRILSNPAVIFGFQYYRVASIMQMNQPPPPQTYGTTYYSNMYHTGGPITTTLQSHVGSDLAAATGEPQVIQPEESYIPVDAQLQQVQYSGQFVDVSDPSMAPTQSDYIPAMPPDPAAPVAAGMEAAAPAPSGTEGKISNPCSNAAEAGREQQKVDCNKSHLSLDIVKGKLNDIKDFVPNKNKKTVQNTADHELKKDSTAAAQSCEKEGGKRREKGEGGKCSNHTGKTVDAKKGNSNPSVKGPCKSRTERETGQDSGCVSDVSSGGGELSFLNLEEPAKSPQGGGRRSPEVPTVCMELVPPPSASLGELVAPPAGQISPSSLLSDDQHSVRSTNNSESSDSHSDASSQHSMSNISSISTQSDVSVPSNKIMSAHKARRGKFGASANAGLVRKLEDIPPIWQNIISSNKDIPSEKFEGPPLVRQNRHKHMPFIPSPHTSDTSLSSGEEGGPQTPYTFNPNAQCFIPGQGMFNPGQQETCDSSVQSQDCQPMMQDLNYQNYQPYDNSMPPQGVPSSPGSIVMPGSNMPLVPNSPPGDGSMNSALYNGGVCCGSNGEMMGDGSPGYGSQNLSNAPTYTIHIIHGPPPGQPGAEGSGAPPGQAAAQAGPAAGSLDVTDTTASACCNSPVSSPPTGYIQQIPQQQPQQVPAGAAGDPAAAVQQMYSSQPVVQQQPQQPPMGTVYYTSPPCTPMHPSTSTANPIATAPPGGQAPQHMPYIPQYAPVQPPSGPVLYPQPASSQAPAPQQIQAPALQQNAALYGPATLPAPHAQPTQCAAQPAQ